jgi:L,D-transpeptidase-like protein/putative peptidoglycan binding protein
MCVGARSAVACSALLSAALLAVSAIPAGAQTGGGMRLTVEGAHRVGSGVVVAAGQRVRLHGYMAPYVPGQVAVVRVNIHGRRYLIASRPIVSVGDHGEFAYDFRVPRSGVMHASALHAATGELGRLAANSPNVTSVLPFAGRGSHGLRIVFLQGLLLRLGYYSPVTGYYNDATARAVLAFRKVNRLGLSGWAGRAVFIRAAEGRGGYPVYNPSHGRHVEADLGRQVLALINPGGRVYRVFIMSSGKPSTPSVRGNFKVEWKEYGRNKKGMLDSNYFYGGYAIHGYPEVPNHPASHGCLRIPNPNAWFVNRWLTVGTPVDVFYRGHRAPARQPVSRNPGP